MTTLQKRALSALVLGPVVLAAVWAGGPIFTIMVAAVFAVSLQEWARLSLRNGRICLSFLIAGALYLAVSCAAALWLRMHDAAGLYLLFYLFFAIWACDMGAYGAGKAIGGPKMAPAISPNKTWAGLVGGCLAATLAVSAFDAFMGEDLPLVRALPLPVHALTGAFLGVVGQLGDLMVSVFKRRCGLKDTGNIIPGHGGLLDRIDALLLALPVFALLVYALEAFP